jgi:hypothetical protein
MTFSGGKLANVATGGGSSITGGTVIKLTGVYNGIEVVGNDCTLSPASDSITVLLAGLWRVHAQAFLASGGLEFVLQCLVYVNGVERSRRWDFVVGASAFAEGTTMKVDTVLDLQAGDVVDIRGRILGAVAAVPGWLQTDDFFEVQYLGV